MSTRIRRWWQWPTARCTDCNRDGPAAVRRNIWLGAPDTDSTLIAPPHPRETNWHIPKGGPAWLRFHPAIIDDLLTQFGELPARRERRLRVVRQQMHMRIDCDRLAIGCLEVRRHPCCHDEEGMKSNEHIRRATPGKPRRFHV